MTINVPTGGNAGDLSRAVTHEMDQSWPERVELRVVWKIPGPDGLPILVNRTQEITAAQFFGSGGAPIAGDFVIGAIERMRRMGPPAIPLVISGAKKVKRGAPVGNANAKKLRKVRK